MTTLGFLASACGTPDPATPAAADSAEVAEAPLTWKGRKQRPYHPLDGAVALRSPGEGAGPGWYTAQYTADLAQAVSVAEELDTGSSYIIALHLVAERLGPRLDAQTARDFERFDDRPSRREWNEHLTTLISNAEPTYAELCGGQDVEAVFARIPAGGPYVLFDTCKFASLDFHPRSYLIRNSTRFSTVAVLALHELASRGGVLPLEWTFLRMLVGEPPVVRATYREQRDHLARKGWLRDVPPQPAADIVVPDGFTEVAYPSGSLELRAWVAEPRGTNKHSVVLLHAGPTLRATDFEVATPFLEAGWGVMVPTYRAEHGNPGVGPFLLGDVDDAENATKWLAQRAGVGRSVHVFGTGRGSLVADVLTLHAGAAVESSASVDGLWFESDFGRLDPEDVLFDPLDAAHLAPRMLFGHVDEMQTPHYAFITVAHSDVPGALAYARVSGPANGKALPKYLVSTLVEELGSKADEAAARWFIRCANDSAECPTWAESPASHRPRDP